MFSDLIYKIAINQIPNIGAATSRLLLSHLFTAERVFTCDKRTLVKIPGIAEKTADYIILNREKAIEIAQKEANFIQKNEVQFLFNTDYNFPQRLKHLPDAPLSLFYKGNASLNPERTVSIVGTRAISPYGKEICEEIVNQLKPYDVTILSGLAYGVDIVAHKKSLEVEIPTIGIMGTGLGRIYPYENKETAHKMISNGGLLTEFISTKGPEREHFPMRNRLVAGMSDVVIVVETPAIGGSMITANMANDYSKDVFAVPGRVNDINSEGCNNLIKTNKAHLLTKIDDLAYIMRWEKSGSAVSPKQRTLFWELDDQEQNVVTHLRNQPDISIDELSFKSGNTHSSMAGILLNLEFKGVIKQMPGKRYQLV